MPARRTKTGCERCRTRHLKCDSGRNSCSRCVRAGVECVRGHDFKFRHGSNPSVANIPGSGLTKCEYEFTQDQTWCKSPTQLKFVDETREVVHTYLEDSDAEDDITPPDEETYPYQNPSPAVSAVLSVPGGGSIAIDAIVKASTASPIQQFDAPFQSPAASFKASPEQARAALHSPPNSTSSHRQHDSITSPTGSHALAAAVYTPTVETYDSSDHPTVLTGEFGFSTVSESLSRIYLDTPVWPLQDREEAKLMRYFIENIARFFDLCDPQRHFAIVVPSRASSYPVLLNAVLATSARHLSRVSDFDPYISDRYHQECLNHLIPLLSDNAAVMDEHLLAATIILRFLEDVEVPRPTGEPGSYLLGSHIFMNAQGSATIEGGLRQASFWCGLRQEINFAFLNQQTVAPAFSNCNLDRSFAAADDATWANRIILHCADVLRWCFGSDGEHSVAAYSEMVQYAKDWITFKPGSFAPMFFKGVEEGGEDVFPEIWLLNDTVVTGLQHYHLAQILLCAHNPKIPRLGPASKVAMQQMDEEIRGHVREVCGMALSNPMAPPNFSSASLAVVCAGDKFSSRRDQESLIEILIRTEKEHAWHSGPVQTYLKEAWGWPDA